MFSQGDLKEMQRAMLIAGGFIFACACILGVLIGLFLRGCR